MSLFDCYVAVDWSAANAPRTGKDSIWIAALWEEDGARRLLCENIPTRSAAMRRLSAIFDAGLARNRRILAGFDFAFGYPSGFAEKVVGHSDWQSVWHYLGQHLVDDDANRSNRFEVGSQLNEAIGSPMFWGKPHQHTERYPFLPARKPPPCGMREWRAVEQRVRSAKSVYQLAYNGAVGSQTLLGIARLERLRRQAGPRVRVWPFETGFADHLPGGPSVTFAEIYPTLFLSEAPRGEVRDAAQVRAVVRGLFDRDRCGTLRPLLEPPPGTTAAERQRMLREEGSIVGAGVLGTGAKQGHRSHDHSQSPRERHRAVG